MEISLPITFPTAGLFSVANNTAINYASKLVPIASFLYADKITIAVQQAANYGPVIMVIAIGY